MSDSIYHGLIVSFAVMVIVPIVKYLNTTEFKMSEKNQAIIFGSIIGIFCIVMISVIAINKRSTPTRHIETQIAIETTQTNSAPPPSPPLATTNEKSPSSGENFLNIFYTIIGFILLLGIALICFFIYFLPTIVARHKRNATAIFALNLLLGWTLIGWIVSLVWSLTKDPER